MSANLLYVTSNAERATALMAICVEENYNLTVCMPGEETEQLSFDLIFCDSEAGFAFGTAPTTIPVVAIYNVAASEAINQKTLSSAIDLLSFPFDNTEAVARLRSLSRLNMLRDELQHRSPTLAKETSELPVLIIGNEASREAIKISLGSNFQIECADDDLTGLLCAARGSWSCVVLALSNDSRDPAPMIRQMRVLDRTRTTPVLVHTDLVDGRCVSSLQAGANDIIVKSRSELELLKRIRALALRKTVLDALRADAASIAPLSDFDHATGLPGPTQLTRTLPKSLERLKAQGKPASLLLVAVDPLPGMSENDSVPDHVMLALTQVLRRSLRGFDFACRFTSDCFAILMPGADALGAEAVAQRICAEIKSEKVRLTDGRKDGTTVSIGLATMAAPNAAASAENMIGIARDSLNKAQALGAAQVVSQELRLAA